MASVEQHEYGHDLAVRHPAGAVAVTLVRYLEGMFFQLWRKIFAEFLALLNNTSSRIQKISIIFAVVMEMGVCS